MWSLLRKLWVARNQFSARRALGDALALHRRGEVRPDGLFPFTFAVRLTVNWRERDIHPWDRDMPENCKAPRLVQQTLKDTEDAVERIFAAFPEANTLEVNVFERDPASNRVIVSGVVRRSDLGRVSSSSIWMRLRMLGITYRLVNDHLEPIAVSATEPKIVDRIDSIARDLRSGRGLSDINRPSAELAVKARSRLPDSEHRPN